MNTVTLPPIGTTITAGAHASLSGMTLQQARGLLQTGAIAKGGTTCLCCERYAKLYTRKMHKAMARRLIAIHRHGHGQWVHGEDLFNSIGLGRSGRDWHLSRWWGLIDRQQSGTAKKPRDGIYRMTQKGEDFVLGNISVPMFVLLWDDQALGFAGKQVDIYAVCGTLFNYHEMMNT